MSSDEEGAAPSMISAVVNCSDDGTVEICTHSFFAPAEISSKVENRPSTAFTPATSAIVSMVSWLLLPPITTTSASANDAVRASLVVLEIILPANNVAATNAAPMAIAIPAAIKRPALRRICAKDRRNIRRSPSADRQGQQALTLGWDQKYFQRFCRRPIRPRDPHRLQPRDRE